MRRFPDHEMWENSEVPLAGMPVATRAPEYGRGLGVRLPGSNWGGCRNSGNRVTDALTARQVAMLVESSRKAIIIGLPLNRHITLHLEAAGISNENAPRVVRSLLKAWGDWVRYHGGGFAALWVRENGPNKGNHVHIATHVPQALACGFWPMVGRSKRRAGFRRRVGAKIQLSRAIGGYVNAAEAAPGSYAANLASLIEYLAKGVTPDGAQITGIARRLEAGGVIIGKRCGCTRNICGLTSPNGVPTGTRN